MVTIDHYKNPGNATKETTNVQLRVMFLTDVTKEIINKFVILNSLERADGKFSEKEAEILQIPKCFLILFFLPP